jgi:hypothetical protein
MVRGDAAESNPNGRATALNPISINGDFMTRSNLHPSAGTVDYIREMPNNKRGGIHRDTCDQLPVPIV